MRHVFTFTAFLSASLVLATGCTSSTPPAPPAAERGHGHDHSHPHGHAPGPHGGVLADWGGGAYHVEFTVNHDQREATVYILGGDEKTAAPIKAPEIQLSIKAPAFELPLKAAPQPGDPEGQSSRFVGSHEHLGKVQEFAGTITGEVDGTPYTGDFEEEPHGSHGHSHADSKKGN